MSGEVITRYANRAGAVVELHHQRFTTKTDYRGYYHDETSFELSGFNWRCLGCGVTGCSDIYKDRAYRDLDKARAGGQEHADACSALPPEEEQEEQRRRGLSAWVSGLLGGGS
ncbi:hypothetical protein [Nonomuraea wenchangensis]|uniref:Uncharacterized protein n=1 Tax=Nonomuraea wenchangensis TaxID=568860 RepID=A0A1I0LU00_9ACTN|nr:hypothetical protein [Nonomuraea wenchangensis]SEU46726.1 hypothetical protein SAMN05421811_127131 [Nonomuraea wenchangensis]